MASKIKVKLDVLENKNISTQCKQNDDLVLEASIYEGTKELDLTNSYIVIQARKSDLNPIVQDVNINKIGNKIIAELDRDFTRVPGVTYIEIVIIENGKQNTTFTFALIVERSVINSTVQSGVTLTPLEKLQNTVVESNLTDKELKNTISSARENNELLKNTVIAATETSVKAEENVNNLNLQNTTADTNISTLTLKNTKAEENITNLDTKNTEAVTNIAELETKIAAAGEVKAETEQLIATGGAATKEDIATVNSSLEQNIQQGEKSGLAGWKSIFELNRNKNIVIIGDSTSDPITTSSNLWNEINNYYKGSGDLLEGATITNIAQNGSQIRTFILGYNNTGKNLPDAVSLQGDLYVICYGINDVRLGATTKEQLIDRFKIVINELLTKTKGYILLRMPNSLGATDPANTGWVSPLSSAQDYTNILYETYKYFEAYSPRVAVLDTQTLLFGRTCKDVVTNELMTDVLHPSPLGYKKLARLLVDTIGVKSKFREDLKKDAYSSNSLKPYLIYPKLLEDDNKYIVVNQGYIKGGATNYLDFYGDISKISEIKNGDIIKVGDLFAYEFTGNVYNMSSTYIRFAEQTFTGLTGSEKGEVKIFRDLTKLKAPETVMRASFTVNANSKYVYNPQLTGNKRYKFSLLVDGGFMFGDFFNEGSTLYRMSEIGTQLTFGNDSSVAVDGKWSVYISAIGGEITIENKTTASRLVTLYIFPINY